jgi:hypothetical protein
MTRRQVTVLAFVAIGAASGCVYVETTDGSGVSATQRHELSDFDEVEINGVFDLVSIEICDCDTVAIVRGDDNVVPDLDFDHHDDELELNGVENIVPRLPLEVRIQTRDLKKVEFNGVGNVSVKGVFSDTFEVANNGVGAVKIRGEAREVDVESAGTGHVDASRLRAKIVDVNSAGTGDVEVCATQELHANVAGIGSVFYSCEPASFDTNVSGTGAVIDRSSQPTG